MNQILIQHHEPELFLFKAGIVEIDVESVFKLEILTKSKQKPVKDKDDVEVRCKATDSPLHVNGPVRRESHVKQNHRRQPRLCFHHDYPHKKAQGQAKEG